MAGESTRDVKVRLLADPRDFQAGMLAAGKSMRVAQREAYLMERAQKKAHAAMTEAGRGFMMAGGAMAIGLGYATYAAIQWESAWAGVTKTVAGTPAQLESLQAELRQMAQELPTSHQEIAKVAEAAGQLGIAIEDVAAFTRTMIDMGVTTNLSSEEAAEGIAKMMNIMGTAPDKVDELASTIVDLGNKGATTEKDILMMALRISGAGKQIGLTEAEVLAFSATLSNVGIEAEMGGSAISTVFMKMSNAVSDGGDKLEAFAAVAGVSGEKFREIFGKSAASAMQLVVEGLGDISTAGGDTFAALESLGVVDIRQRDAMLRMAGAGSLLAQQLNIANTEWKENGALMAEANKRYQTTESRVLIARNKINDFAISLGNTLLPVLGDVVNMISGLASWFNSMPGWLQGTIGAIGAAAAVLLLLGGAMLMIIPKIAAFNAALGASTNSKVVAFRNGLRGAAGFMMGPWGAAIGVALIGLTMFAGAQADAAADVDALTATLDEQSGAITQNSRVWAANKISEAGIADDLKAAGISVKEFADAALKGGKAYEKMKQKIHDKWEGGAGINLKLMIQTLDELEGEADEAKAKWEVLNAAKDKGKEKAVELSAAEKALADSLGLTGEEAQEAAAAMTSLAEQAKSLIDQTFAVDVAQDNLQEQLDKTKEAAMANGGALEGNSEAARENRRNMEGLVSSTAALAEATHKQTGSTQAARDVIQEQITWIKKNGAAMGMTKAEVEKYVEALESIKSIYPTEVRTTYTSVYKMHHVKAKDDMGHRADGGWINGPGGPRDDRVPMWLSNGEYVVNARDAARNASLLEYINGGGSSGGIHTKSTPVAATPGSGGGGTHIDNLNVHARHEPFKWRDVEQELKYRGFD